MHGLAEAPPFTYWGVGLICLAHLWSNNEEIKSNVMEPCLRTVYIEITQFKQ